MVVFKKDFPVFLEDSCVGGEVGQDSFLILWSEGSPCSYCAEGGHGFLCTALVLSIFGLTASPLQTVSEPSLLYTPPPNFPPLPICALHLIISLRAVACALLGYCWDLCRVGCPSTLRPFCGLLFLAAN